MMQQLFEMDSTTVILSSTIIAVFLQLWLCRKAKRILIKLIPIVLLTILTIAFYICSVCISGWDSFGYLFFALLSFGLIWVCGISWFFVRLWEKVIARGVLGFIAHPRRARYPWRDHHEAAIFMPVSSQNQRFYWFQPLKSFRNAEDSVLCIALKESGKLKLAVTEGIVWGNLQ